ncbi:hypothetical protein QL093DRAFT_2145895 [Fusarium oxysporum]|jgi:hypothetical protein|nr:hypothetical protein QL093DRAFT_2145895 [Fusarium oxysporum]
MVLSQTFVLPREYARTGGDKTTMSRAGWFMMPVLQIECDPEFPTLAGQKLGMAKTKADLNHGGAKQGKYRKLRIQEHCNGVMRAPRTNHRVRVRRYGLLSRCQAPPCDLP